MGISVLMTVIMAVLVPVFMSMFVSMIMVAAVFTGNQRTRSIPPQHLVDITGNSKNALDSGIPKNSLGPLPHAAGNHCLDPLIF